MQEEINRIFDKEGELNRKILELEEIIQSAADPKEKSESIKVLLNELKLELVKSHYTALTDDLTGLLNKRVIKEVYARKVAEAKRNKSCLSMLLLDVDYLKKFNDKFGHLMGTKLIEEFAKAMTSSIRGQDIASRYGGDEFLLLCVHKGPEGLRKITERIKSNVAKIDLGFGFSPTISIGHSNYCKAEGEPKNFDELFEEADKALYEAKKERILPDAFKELTSK